jgi:ABC-type sugar transport system permease subunit
VVAGLISVVWVIAFAVMGGNMDFENGQLYGYGSMILAFSVIFVAIRNYRDKYNDGLVSFGKAFKIGLLITLVASTIYVVVWLVEYYFFIPDFGEKYAAHMLEAMKAKGASAKEIEMQVKEMASFNELYKNPFFNAMVTYVEIVPVGIVISLIAAAILKRNTKTQTQTA